MSATTSRGYPYPQLTDDVDPPGDLQDLAEAIDADVQTVAAPPLCYLVQQPGGTQTGWATVTPTAITFGSGSTQIDSDGIHSESSNTSRLVIGNKLGWWEVNGLFVPAGNAGNSESRALFYKNGSYISGSAAGWEHPADSHLYGIPTPVIEVEATASGDYVELMGYMTASATPRGTGLSTYLACSVRAKWIRESS